MVTTVGGGGGDGEGGGGGGDGGEVVGDDGGGRCVGSFVLHLPIFYLLGFCWDDHSRPQMCWDRSQQLPSQTPTIHPS